MNKEYYIIGLDKDQKLEVKKDAKYLEHKASDEKLGVVFHCLYERTQAQLDRARGNIDKTVVIAEIVSDGVVRKIEGSQFLIELTELHEKVMKNTPELLV